MTSHPLARADDSVGATLRSGGRPLGANATPASSRLAAGLHPVDRSPAECDIEVAGLTRSFGAKPVLRGVDLALARGQRMALLGPNGAGKTTLLRILATLSRPDAGRVRIAGHEAQHDASAIRRVTGYVGHQPYLYDELTARENLIFFARMYHVAAPDKRAAALLERVGMAPRANDRVRTLSRGQQQRLALARGILHEPRLLLLDEPDTGLDEQAGALLADLLAERAAAGQTTLFTTHNLERALALAGAVALLARGRIVYRAETAATDLTSLRHTFQQFAEPRR